MKFSQRKGLTSVRKVIQTEGMSNDLRNSLWNLLAETVWNAPGFLYNPFPQMGEIRDFSFHLWSSYFKRAYDTRPTTPPALLKAIRHHFFDAPWHQAYDFLEWMVNAYPELTLPLNGVLERELAGYRIVGGMITDITSEQEVKALEDALADREFPGVRAHLDQALRLLSDKKAPDFRNSIKESISAVEAMAQHVSGKRKATLGDALAVLEKKKALHPALKEGFSKLYGYTGDGDGIRHAMMDEAQVDAARAKFFLLSCTAFINFLKSSL